MTPLDKKLKEIQVDCYDGWALLKRVPLSEENIAQIKQAFQESGYINGVWTQHDENDDHLPINTLMTGPEWFSRFEKETHKLISRGDGETWMGWGCGEVLRAARRASGIE